MIKTTPEKKTLQGVDALKAVKEGVQRSLGKRVANIDISFVAVKDADDTHQELKIEVDILGGMKGPKTAKKPAVLRAKAEKKGDLLHVVDEAAGQ